MNRSIIRAVILITILGLAGCMKKNCDCDPKSEFDQPVLFQYEYYNYAWGFRHRGFLIDAQGKVNGFKQPAKWITPDSLGMMSVDDLKFNLSQCDTVCTKVDHGDLVFYFNKIEEVRSGKIENNGYVMADAGTGVLSAWYWNKKLNKFDNVFLISNGDLYKINTHPSVKQIVEWLKEVGAKTDRFYWYGLR